MPLQYTFLQLATGGVINDHTARAVIPFLHLGSILAAYTLGHRLFGRRVGIYTAAIWALYPHVADWSRFGDLEIPTTFLFTAAAAFFLLAWRHELPEISSQPLPKRVTDPANTETSPPTPRSIATESGQRVGLRSWLPPHRRRYAISAGLLLGIGMWTKPTMGAFIWGVVALVAVDLAQQIGTKRSGFSLAAFRQRARFRVALWTAIVCIPLGAVWYLRNIILGHAPITMPTDFWPTLAARSGVEFGWPLLALLLLVVYVLFDYGVGTRFVVATTGQPDKALLRLPQLLIGLALVLVALLPSINQPRRMVWTEYLVLTTGAGLLVVAQQKYLRRRWPGTTSQLVWALLLALPYFITWFYSYSYHYRLSFPIVPLLVLPTAVILARWTQKLLTALAAAQKPWRLRIITALYLTALVLLAGPGVINALYDPNAGWDWLWTDKLPDDLSKYASGNPALMAVVNGLEIFEQDNGRLPVVVAPGIVRLPFFFPTAEIRTQAAPTRLSQLDGIDYFIYGMPETRGMYQTIPLQQNQVVSALALADYDSSDQLIRKAWWHDDGNFNYTVYELHLAKRFIKPEIGAPTPEGDVVFGEFVRFLGHNIGGDYFFPGRKIIMNLYWEVLAPPPDDYMVYIHLRDAQGKVWESWDGPVTRSADGNYYSTRVWAPGEYIDDKRLLVHNQTAIPLGKDYAIVIGLYNLQTGARVPLTINGQPVADGYVVHRNIAIVPEENR
ncbi:MAG TPA: hypothetical protein VHO69_17025 [Phototrophicaceae bacterium]|nr:hypothetical protein [Phototrophicaceae bacterium]